VEFRRHSVTRVGEIARLCLAPGRRGRVLACVTGAVFLQSENGDLCWLSQTGSPMHRRAAQLRDSLPRWQAGTPLVAGAGGVLIGSEVVLNLDEALTWRAETPDRDLPFDARRLAKTLREFGQELDVSSARGFGCFLPEILWPGLITAPNVDVVLEAARRPVLEAARACIQGEPGKLRSALTSLVGLGAGLTPSGDDFCGGILFTLKHLGGVFPEVAGCYPSGFMDFAHARTNRISAVLLEDLAKGHAIGPLHQLINHFLMGDSLDRIHFSVAQLARVGHSTGWDLLAGLVAGLLATCCGDRAEPIRVIEAVAA